MAFRVEIGEDVESAIGLNITGAAVEVRFHGGAQAPVYDSENGGALVTQPLTTVNGKIGPDYPNGAWVASGDYDLLVTFGGDTLTYFWSAVRGDQFVTALPAGAGTSAPEDGEKAIELYDAVNGGAWLRRYRAAATQWDMIGGPPPAAASLPGTPRARQEVYLTGGTPAVQHLRYNGATWDYVGTPPTIPVPGSPLTIGDVGDAASRRAGRNLVVADYTTLLQLPTTPVLVAPLNATTNLGTGGALTNKGTVTFAAGILGTTHAAQFDGTTAKALYITDTGAADPFRIKTGSWGCWINTAKRGTTQDFLSKWGVAGQAAYILEVNANNVVVGFISTDGTTTASVSGNTDVCDGRWHWITMTSDGTRLRLYVDGVLDGGPAAGGLIFAGSSPLDIGIRAADATNTAAGTNPFFGRIDEAFVTPDVLSDDQVRLLYAAAIPHGYATTPTRAVGAVRRRQRGGPMATTDFPAQPVRLHNFVAGALTDQGSGGVALVTNVGAGVQTPTTAPNGVKDDAYTFSGAHTGLSATDTGLPAALASRSYGLWFKVSAVTTHALLGWGTSSTAHALLYVSNTTSLIGTQSGADNMTGPFVGDGLWHHAVVVEDNAATDLVKRKLYLDGRLVSGSTVLTSLTLAGANRFRLGADPLGASPMIGQADGAFVYAGALTAEQVRALYNLGSRALGPAPVNADEMIEAIDATNLYVVLDRLDGQHQLDLAVAS